jgi:hypothetical protein
MVTDPIEQRDISFVSFHDLEGRSAFKITLQEVEGRSTSTPIPSRGC